MKKFIAFKQEKLWRDKADVRFISFNGEISDVKIHFKTLTDEEFADKLDEKLQEEVDEVKKASTIDEKLEEIADVISVIEAIAINNGSTLDVILAMHKKKIQERGGFTQRKYVTYTEYAEGSYGELYCRKQPDKYPEIKKQD